ncbi:MAG TPA: lysylphosphatidylglycerol synthase transmembrane domain-containing protein, partial [Chitinophagales bacterium]|nr:lysylphosphatidylglycerol synthase transmembrane domain-containing protein [Chitinophagales bacterium]
PKIEHLPYFATYILLAMLSFWLQAARWKYFFSDADRTKIETFFPSVMAGHFFNTILPMRVGEIIKPYHLSSKYQIPFKPVVTTCIADKLIDIAAIGAIAFIIFYQTILNTISIGFQATTLLYVLIAIVTAGIIYYFLKYAYTKDTADLKRYLERSVIEYKNALRILENIKDFQKITGIVLLTVLLWILVVAGNFTLLYATGLPEKLITIDTAVYITVCTTFAYAIPSAPASLGTYNYAVVLALEQALLKNNIAANPEMQNTIVLASGIFYLVSILPDFIAGLFLVMAERKFVLAVLRGNWRGSFPGRNST